MESSRLDPKILIGGPSPRGWHRLQLASECLQKYAWAYEGPRGGEKKSISSAPALAKGSLFHLALAQHYMRMKCRQEGKDEEEWCHPEEAVALVGQLEHVEQWIDVIQQTYRAYEKKYIHDEDTWKIISVEELGYTQIQGRYLLTGRRDLVIEDASGRIHTCDHKTSSRLTARHKQYYAMSGQLLGYDLMARQQYGDRYAGMLLNLAEIGGKNFDRLVLPRSPNLEAQFERHVADIEISIERLQEEKRPYDQWPKAMSELTCVTRYGPCEFIDQCRFGAGASKAGNWSWENDV